MERVKCHEVFGVDSRYVTALSEICVESCAMATASLASDCREMLCRLIKSDTTTDVTGQGPA